MTPEARNEKYYGILVTSDQTHIAGSCESVRSVLYYHYCACTARTKSPDGVTFWGHKNYVSSFGWRLSLLMSAMSFRRRYNGTASTYYY